jgi:tetratricopeptide (TPR) repeat protein
VTKDRKIFLGFGVLVLLVYGQSLFGGFVFDDRGIAEHAELWTGVDQVVQVASYPYWMVDAGLYRPVTLLSYLFNSLALGHGAFGFHLVNLLLYWGIGVLIYVLLRKLFGKESFALLAAAFFLVLPIHTEVVANISGRSELLALFFSLLTLYEFTREAPRPWRAFLWMFLAIGSKETAIAALPLALLILHIREGGVMSRLGEVLRKHQYSIVAICGGAGLYFFLRFLVLPGHFLGVETSIIENPLLFASASERIATALSILWMYVEKTFVPLGLCSDYSYSQIPTHGFASLTTLLGGALLLSSAFTTLYFISKKPIVSFASAVFLFSFILVSNIPFPIGTIAGERLFFFPSLGFTILLAWLVARQRALLILAGVLIAVYAALSFTRQSVWMSEERLFLNAAECAPQSVLSLSNAGTVYYFRGDYAKAEEYLLASKAIKPVYSKGLNNLGLVYWKEGRTKDALAMYHAALLQKYPYPGALENLALLYASLGREADALRWLRIKYPNAADSALRSLF